MAPYFLEIIARYNIHISDLLQYDYDAAVELICDFKPPPPPLPSQLWSPQPGREDFKDFLVYSLVKQEYEKELKAWLKEHDQRLSEICVKEQTRLEAASGLCTQYGENGKVVCWRCSILFSFPGLNQTRQVKHKGSPSPHNEAIEK